MRLDLDGTNEISAPPDRVWARLLDAHFVAACAPGIRAVETIDETRYVVHARFGVGVIRLGFRVEVELSDLVAPEAADLAFRGKARGSDVEGRATTALAPCDVGTELSWQVAATLRGTIASVGGRLLKSTTRKLITGFWATFAERAADEEAA